MTHCLPKNGLWTILLGFLLSIPLSSNAQQALKQAARAAKVTPDLYLAAQRSQQIVARSQRPPTTVPTVSDPDLVPLDLTMVKDGKIAIEAIADDQRGQTLLNDLRALGLTDANQFQRVVFGYLPLDRVNALQSLPSLRFARAALKPKHNAGVVTSGGDRALRADIARQTTGLTGAGTKVGVLSDSYNALGGAPAGVASGDLPTGVQISDDSPDGEDEGRAMAEIVHDVAPGAAIAFNTANKGQSGFANGILNLAKLGCNVIVDDIIYLAEPFFQDGIVAQAVNQVATINKVAYFSSAGNQARQSYTNAFVNSGKPAPLFRAEDGVAHNFLDGNVLQSITIPARGSFQAMFQWDDPFYSVSGGTGAVSDLDVYVYYQGRLLTYSASNNLGDDPYEYIALTNNGTTPVTIQIAIVKYSGPDPSAIKWVDFGNSTAQYATRSSTLYGHANAEGAIAVGAAYYRNTPVFRPNLAAPILESFSSTGGTPILFSTTGQRVGPVVRQKPEITAPDGGSTTFFYYLQGDTDGDGYPNFFGTSAAAPHAAAVAALMQQQNGNGLSPDNVRTNLIRSAIDMDDPATAGFDAGFDFGTGYGFIPADRALALGPPFALIKPTYNCETHQLTVQTTNSDGSPIEYRIPGVTDWTTNPTQTLEAGLVNDPNTTTLLITARQNGKETTLAFNFREACLPPVTPVPGETFEILPPIYNCQTGSLTFRTTVGDGTPIEYRSPGLTDWTTNPVTVLDVGAFLDPNTTTLTLYARQNGKVVSLTFNFREACANIVNIRVASAEAVQPASLQVFVLGNPTPGDWAEVEIQGIPDQPFTLRVSNSLGKLISEQAIGKPAPDNRYRVALGRTTGIYLLQIQTATQTKAVKILRQ